MLCYFLAITIVIKLPRAKIFINLQEINFTKKANRGTKNISECFHYFMPQFLSMAKQTQRYLEYYQHSIVKHS